EIEQAVQSIRQDVVAVAVASAAGSPNDGVDVLQVRVVRQRVVAERDAAGKRNSDLDVLDRDDAGFAQETFLVLVREIRRRQQRCRSPTKHQGASRAGEHGVYRAPADRARNSSTRASNGDGAGSSAAATSRYRRDSSSLAGSSRRRPRWSE